ncbi:hypothetical protein GCM10027174_04500 [Salinifilum aidingensis]
MLRLFQGLRGLLHGRDRFRGLLVGQGDARANLFHACHVLFGPPGTRENAKFFGFATAATAPRVHRRRGAINFVIAP